MRVRRAMGNMAGGVANRRKARPKTPFMAVWGFSPTISVRVRGIALYQGPGRRLVHYYF